MYDMKKKKMMAEGGMMKNPMKEEGADIDQKTTNFLDAPAKQYANGGYAEGGKPKGAVMAIVAKLKKKPEGEMPMGGEEESPEGEMKAHEEGYKVAAEEMMSAMKSGDSAAFAESLKNFIQMCGMSED